MKTIARNRTAKINEIFAKAASAKSYTLTNGFNGVDCDPVRVRDAFLANNRAKLTVSAEGKYTVYHHSNHWVEVVSAG